MLPLQLVYIRRYFLAGPGCDANRRVLSVMGIFRQLEDATISQLNSAHDL